MKSKLFFSSDHNGIFLLKELLTYCKEKGYWTEEFPVKDLDYIDVTLKAVEFVHHHADSRAILICGSGIGVSIAANRNPNVRAALCRTPEDVRLARRQNDANILCLGSRYTSTFVAKQCIDKFLSEPFKVENHQSSVNKLSSIFLINLKSY